jgi:hypothetical protein
VSSVPNRTSGTLIRFQAARHVRGYHVKVVSKSTQLEDSGVVAEAVKAGVIRESAKVGAAIVPRNYYREYYEDLPPDLFRKFAGLRRRDGRIDEGAILDFANTWGMLTLPLDRGSPVLSPVQREKYERAVERIGRSLPLEIGGSHDFANDEMLLSFAFADPPNVVSSVIDREALEREAESISLWRYHISEMSLALELAKYERDPERLVDLSKMVNGRLENVAYQTRLGNDNPRSITTYLTSKTLIGLMWLQLVDALVTQGFRQCWGCGEWISFPLEKGPRSDRMACSAGCRSLAYKKHKKLTLEMSAGGKSAIDIANELGRTIEQVNKWLRISNARKSNRNSARRKPSHKLKKRNRY